MKRQPTGGRSSTRISPPFAITASGAADSDYTISYVAGTLTVDPAGLTITADDKTKTYGAANPAL